MFRLWRCTLAGRTAGERSDIMAHFAHAHNVFSQTTMCKEGSYKQQWRITELCEASSPRADLVHSTIVMSEAVWLCMPVLVHAFIIVVLLVLMALLQNVLCAGAQFVYVLVCLYGMSLHHRLPDRHAAFSIVRVNVRMHRKDVFTVPPHPHLTNHHHSFVFKHSFHTQGTFRWEILKTGASRNKQAPVCPLSPEMKLGSGCHIKCLQVAR